MSTLKSIPLAMLAALLLAFPAATCLADEDEQTAAQSEAPVVHLARTVEVTQQDVDEELHVYGRVNFDDAWLQNISLAYSGQIIRLPVLAGEPVEKGQLLAEVAEDPAAAASYQQALSAVHFAESEQLRIANLLKDQLATKSQLASAEKALADSRSQLEKLRQQGLGKSIREIRADFDAVVAAVPAQAGQRIPAGTTILQLGHPDHLKVLLGVEAEHVRRIAPGNRVVIYPAMQPGSGVTASVDKVLRAINPQTRLADLLVRLSGARAQAFLPGMAVSADVSARHFAGALVVPRQAVLYDAHDAPYVMRIDKGKADRVPVKVVFQRDGRVVIAGDIHAGQSVATTGVAELTDGDTVQVQIQGRADSGAAR